MRGCVASCFDCNFELLVTKFLVVLSRVELLPGEQPGQIGLFFSSVQNEDLGTYKCTALYANNQQLTTTFKLTTYGEHFNIIISPVACL